MIKKTLPFLLAAALGLSASAMVQAAGTAPKSKSVPLSQQVQDLRETVLQLQKQVDYLEMLVPPSTAVLMPDARKLSSIRVNGATFLMSIDHSASFLYQFIFYFRKPSFQYIVHFRFYLGSDIPAHFLISID